MSARAAKEGGARTPVSELAARYGASERTVLRWIAHGKKAGDECPIESPVDLVGWWSRNMRQRVPDRISAAVVAQVDEEKPAPDAAPPPDDEAVAVGEVGLAAELGRLEKLAALLALKAHEPGQTKPYLDALARMGAISEKLRTEAERLRKLKPTEMVEDAIRGFHAGIEREFRGQYRAMCDLCELVPSPKREEQWNELCDRLFERMGEEVLR